MNGLIFYLTLPFIYLISLLPFWLMYRVSDLVFVVLYHGLSYRKEVVVTNLRNSFPEKSEEEIQAIAKRFFRYFCDLILEAIKTLTISPRQAKKHLTFKGLEVLEQYYEKKQSIILVLGHFGNWELTGARFAVEPVHQLYIIYRPLKNKYFDQLAYHMRTRLGNRLYPMKETAKGMMDNSKDVTATAFIADQTPSPRNALWLDFLQQDTPVFLGTERLARKFNYPVVYMSSKRPKRGHYTIELELLFDNPMDTADNEITLTHTKRLEKDIKEQPEIWLWTHRRWKHKRPQPQNDQ